MKSANKLLYSAIFILGALGIIDSIVLLLRFKVSVNLGVVLPGVVVISDSGIKNETGS